MGGMEDDWVLVNDDEPDGVAGAPAPGSGLHGAGDAGAAPPADLDADSAEPEPFEDADDGADSDGADDVLMHEADDEGVAFEDSAWCGPPSPGRAPGASREPALDARLLGALLAWGLVSVAVQHSMLPASAPFVPAARFHPHGAAHPAAFEAAGAAQPAAAPPPAPEPAAVAPARDDAYDCTGAVDPLDREDDVDAALNLTTGASHRRGEVRLSAACTLCVIGHFRACKRCHQPELVRYARLVEEQQRVSALVVAAT